MNKLFLISVSIFFLGCIGVSKESELGGGSQAQYTYGKPSWECNTAECTVSLRVTNPPRMEQKIDFSFDVVLESADTMNFKKSVNFNSDEFEKTLTFDFETERVIKSIDATVI